MYAKLFSSIYQGTLRGDTNGLVVFTNLLAHSDSAGWVDIHPRAIADEVGLTIEQVQEELIKMESPDPDSRSPEEEGRRIIRLDEHRAWGWRIVNHAKYRAIRSEEDRREQNRLAQEKWRNKNKPRKPESAQAEAEAEAEVNAKSKTISATRFDALAHLVKMGVSKEIAEDWIKLRKAKKAVVTKTAIDRIDKESDEVNLTLEGALAECCSRGWVGFRAEWMGKGK